MHEIEIVPFTPDHAKSIELREYDARCVEAFGVSREDLGRAYAAGGPGFSGVLDDGEVVACGGVMLQWPGVGLGWAMTSELVEDYALTFHKTFARLIRDLERREKLLRIQTIVHETHTVSQRWLKRLGFEEECLMLKVLGGENYYQYRRLNPWAPQRCR
jgi:hypothetical protein